MDRHTIRDGISFSGDAERVRLPAFAVIDALQRFPAPVQIEATAAALVLLSGTAGMDPHELVSRAKRQLSDLEQVKTAHIDALREYAAGELMK